MASERSLQGTSSATKCYACNGLFPSSQYPVEYNEEGQECCPGCGSEFVERCEASQAPAQLGAAQNLGTASTPSHPEFRGPRLDVGTVVAPALARQMLDPAGLGRLGHPLNFVDGIRRHASMLLPNGQQAYVLQLQDDALLSPFTMAGMGIPFGDALAAPLGSGGDWVVGDDLDVVVTRLLDRYMPPRRSTAQEVLDALPRLRVPPGPLSPTPTAALEETAAAAAAGARQGPQQVPPPPSVTETAAALATPASAVGGILRVHLQPLETAAGAESPGVQLRLEFPAADGGTTEAFAGPSTAAVAGAAARTDGGAAAGLAPRADGFASCHPGELCTVCHDPFETGVEVVELPCRHCFHEACVIPWLQQQNTCPVCRQRLAEATPSSYGNGGATSAARLGAGNGQQQTRQQHPVPPPPPQPQQQVHAERRDHRASAPAPGHPAAGAAAAGRLVRPNLIPMDQWSFFWPGPGGSGMGMASATGTEGPVNAPEAPQPATGSAASEEPASSGGGAVRPAEAAPEVGAPTAAASAAVSPALAAAEAALAELRTRFPPLNLRPPHQPGTATRRAAQPAGAAMGDLMTSIATTIGPLIPDWPVPQQGSRGSAARAAGTTTAAAAEPPPLRRGSQGGGAAVPAGTAAVTTPGHGSTAALRGGFFNQPVNLYGSVLSTAAPRGDGPASRPGSVGGGGSSASAGPGTRSALRGGFFNTGSAGSAAVGASGGAGREPGRSAAAGALGPRLPQRPPVLGGDTRRAPAEAAAAAAVAAERVSALAGSGDSPAQRPGLASQPSATVVAVAASAEPGTGSSSERGREAAGRDRHGRGEGDDESGPDSEDAARPSRQVARRNRHQDAATLAHQPPLASSSPAGDGSSGSGGTSDGTAKEVSVLAAESVNAARDLPDSASGAVARAAAATPPAAAAAGAAGPSGGREAEGEEEAAPDTASAGDSGNAAGADEGSGSGVRAAVKVKVVRRGRPVTARADGARRVGSPPGGTTTTTRGTQHRGRGESVAGGGGGTAAAVQDRGRSNGNGGDAGGEGGRGGLNPLALVVGGAGAGLRFLGGVASGLLRRGSGGGGGNAGAITGGNERRGAGGGGSEGLPEDVHE